MPLTVAIIGNPNTGKSTLFNALTGLQVRVGNFPGVTVEKKIGRIKGTAQPIDLVDLPGTYSLSPRSLDEMVSVNVLLGRQTDVGKVDAVVCILDASNLERNFYLACQVLDLGLPTVIVLNMFDVASTRGVRIDIPALSKKLGVQVVATSAHRKEGLDALKAAIASAVPNGPGTRPHPFPETFYSECHQLASKLAGLCRSDAPSFLVERALLDVGGYLETEWLDDDNAAEQWRTALVEARTRLKDAGCRVPAIEAKARYAWAKQTLAEITTIPSARAETLSDRMDRVLTHRFAGLLIFAVLMVVVFQAIFSWAEPLMGWCEAGQSAASGFVASQLPPGTLRSLLTDGVVAGVGGVLVFLPQIGMLFLFIALLEDCGYLARAAFLMDKVMSKFGLNGKSFVPLMTSHACAIPGIMATRVIEDRRARLATILVAPLMSCSARLPVYTLFISLFVSDSPLLGLRGARQGLTLFAMYALGITAAALVAAVLRKTIFHSETPPFVMELPAYKWPSPWIVFSRVWDRMMAFVTRAGTLIFAAAIVVWAGSFFPGDHSQEFEKQRLIEAAEPIKSDLLLQEARTVEALDKLNQRISHAAWENATERDDILKLTASTQTELAKLKAKLKPFEDASDEVNHMRASLVEQSFLGWLGHLIEPIVKPLGWDWKIGVGTLLSFPARELVVTNLGIIYGLGQDVDESDQQLWSTIREAKWPDGRPVYGVPVALSIMVFFSLCAQCAATLMTIRRETNSWRWPLVTFSYMTSLAYLAALVTYQVAIRI
ncbi:MAG: ferrous iron transport protein B [Planctomycetes bacterium]|nr:ferrous iron transport protein B [Planctomycetota bacterium]